LLSQVKVLCLICCLIFVVNIFLVNLIKWLLCQVVAEPELLQSLGKNICNTFIGVYIRNCKQIIKKSKEIAQFIGVYIKNAEEFT